MAGSSEIHKVVEHGLCIGCGACCLISKNLKIGWDSLGFLSLQNPLPPELAPKSDAVCPFSNYARNEDALGEEIFASHCNHYSPLLGWFLGTFAAAVLSPSVRLRASSGGLGRWILFKLAKERLVDGCIHVLPSGSDTLFDYKISTNTHEILNTAQSAYSPVTLRSVLEEVETRPGTYALTGLPCFIKAVRLLQRELPVFKKKISYTVGLFCGHLKSRFYPEMLAWQLGIGPESLKEVTFRDKTISRNAKDKGFVAWRVNDKNPYGPKLISELFGGSYNLGFFQHKACDYCDDVVAELADVSVGDAWLPEYVSDPRGTSLLIVRRREILKLLEEGRQNGELWLQEVDPERVVDSQAGGFRHRREGLAYRLYLDQRSGRWCPRKRVEPTRRNIGRKRRAIYRLRMDIREVSLRQFPVAKRRQDFESFRREMEPLLKKYLRLYQPSIVTRLARRLCRILSKIKSVRAK